MTMNWEVGINDHTNLLFYIYLYRIYSIDILKY